MTHWIDDDGAYDCRHTESEEELRKDRINAYWLLASGALLGLVLVWCAWQVLK